MRFPTTRDRSGHDVEPKIIAAVGVEPLFAADMLDFAEAAADRAHETFRADHRLDAFRMCDVVFT